MGSLADIENSTVLKSKLTKTVKRGSSRKKIKRSVSSNCTVAHRPWTRSLTRAIENFSFCSIPLRKTRKDLAFKLGKHLSEIMNKENVDNMMEANSQESILVLYGPESNIFSSTDEIPHAYSPNKYRSVCQVNNTYETNVFNLNDEIPHDLQDITLDNFIPERKAENYKLDASDNAVITTALEFEDDLEEHTEFILIDPINDMPIKTMANLYEVFGDELRCESNNIENFKDKKINKKKIESQNEE